MAAAVRIISSYLDFRADCLPVIIDGASCDIGWTCLPQPADPRQRAGIFIPAVSVTAGSTIKNLSGTGGPRYKDAKPEAVIEWFSGHSGIAMEGVQTAHEFDAVLSAWATREAMAKGWDDLVGDDPALLLPAGPVSYLWPAFPMAKSRPNSYTANPAITERKIRRSTASTTAVGYINRNQQEVVRPTGLPGSDHGQSIYVLRCKVCGHEYDENGTGIFRRRCPKHDGGKPGLSYDGEASIG